MPPPGKSVHFNLGYAVGLAWHTTIVPGGPYALKHRHDNSDPALIAQWGQNKICSKSYAKVERTMNVMQPGGFWREVAGV